MTRVLVTGGLGFVGSHLVEQLLYDPENEITVIDNLCSESSNINNKREGVTYWIDDIRNLNTYRFESNFDVIYHLAALARIQPSFEDPLRYFSIDAMGTAEVLEFARSSNAKVIYAGSSSAYGGPKLNPYSFAKYTGEELCKMYSEVYGLSTVTARFFNVYGVRQPTSGPYATIVGIFENLTRAGQKLTVTGDGTQRRDFTHVKDIVRGFTLLSEKEYSGDVFNLGTGTNYSINELAEMFGGKIEYIPARPGEAKNTLADISNITAKTGWMPLLRLEKYVSTWLSANIL